MKSSYLFLILSVLFLAACNGLPMTQESLPLQQTLRPTDTSSPTSTASPTPLATTTGAGPLTLRIWLPPQFDPASGTPAGNLLQARLDEFSKRRPGVRVETRVKAVAGPGGLLDSLSTASAAAPLALPDLMALPRDALETATLQGLLHPYNNLTQVMDDQDWFEYAQQLAHLQGGIYGLPFAGDALVLVYRPALVPEPPLDWLAALDLKSPLAYPAADPMALFTIAQYLANGGEAHDEQDRPVLDAVILSQVLEFYAQAEAAGVMPYWLTQYQGDEQIWEAFQENRADLAATWASHYLGAELENVAIALLPTPKGEPYTLATGWVWALSTRQESHQELSVELAEFLTASSFLANWTEAAGYIPPRPSALKAWSQESSQEMIVRIAASADLLPPGGILTSLGMPFQQATVQILKQQDDPVTAAQAAGASLGQP
ncbi:MAG: extracellular solute-binding protein [Anaerolineales bacterium]|nr:extracellular solute-binding protein [Anaerolineales bacterium]